MSLLKAKAQLPWTYNLIQNTPTAQTWQKDPVKGQYLAEVRLRRHQWVQLHLPSMWMTVWHTPLPPFIATPSCY